MGEAARRAEEIFEGADTQTMDVQRMVDSIEEIARVSERNGAAIEGAAQTARRQAEVMSRTVESSGSLADLSGQMHELVQRFDTGRLGATSEDS